MPIPSEPKALAEQLHEFIKQKQSRMFALVLANMCVLAVLLTFIAIPRWPFTTKSDPASAVEQEQIRKAVKLALEEQMYAYKRPDIFNSQKAIDSQLVSFVPTSEGGIDIGKVEESIKRLSTNGWYYGKDADLNNVNFGTITISGDTAQVETNEQWYLPLYRQDGTRVVERNPYFGPYSIKYTLKKIDGRWLVQDSTRPYAVDR